MLSFIISFMKYIQAIPCTMHQCCVFGCKNEGIHLFPRDKKLRKQWEILTHCKDFTAKYYSRICSEHFTSEDYAREGYYSGLSNNVMRLKKGVVPSIFKWTKSKICEAKRSEERAENQDVRRKLTFDETLTNLTKENNFEEILTALDTDICVSEVEVVTESILESEKSVHNNVGKLKCDIGVQNNYQFYTVESFRNDNKGIAFYTGLETFEKFRFVFSTLCPEAYSLKYRHSQVLLISAEDQFLLTLMKLKRNKEDYELGRFFDISTSSVSNIFITWINFMYQMWEMLDLWPNRDMINYYMPEGFKKTFPTTRVIVDCTEIPIQKPSNPAAQQAVWSTYKNRSTVKVEVGASPSGLLTHCSGVYGGSTSDRQIVERSTLLQKCQKGDSIMADRGFNVQDIFASKGVAINIPTFLKGKHQLPGQTVLKDRKLASKRIHIERMIGLTKSFKILQIPVNSNYVPLMTKIYFVCQMLCNFRERIVSQYA